MVSVYDGWTCIGFVLARVKTGFEAFGADDHSRGVFPTITGMEQIWAK
jgi:hypothetical protein